ncbi:Hsp70 family protein [Ramlibacter sp.]|uniref:Hsp70 family protein n=1 Tax=Ramlibacter sp. TaxID=1917967 RepID=UPI0035B36F63
MHTTLGIDFGTSNSAAAWRRGAEPARALRLEGEHFALPTALFFNAEDGHVYFGREALAQYLSGAEGRLMRSLKSLLGSPLLLEQTEVNGRAMSFQDIIGRFLREIAARARAECGAEPSRVVLGRPVHFVDDDPARDALAQQMLHDAATAAGLREVSFRMEPIAAAFDYEQRIPRESLVLITDIGGGTSDFTVVRLRPGGSAPDVDRSGDVLATRGVHIGGTDFDQKLSLEHAMPLLGYRHRGPDGREVPSAVFFDLATWHMIHWRYGPRALREAQALRVNYTDTNLHRRLMTVLEQRLGHHLASDVEQAKIATSQHGGAAQLDLAYVEAGLACGFDAATMTRHLHDLLQRVVACAQDCVQAAGLTARDLDAIYLTGGSSALRPYQQVLQAAFPGVAMVEGDLFGGVAAGLVYGVA